jgi:hypothetical protein
VARWIKLPGPGEFRGEGEWFNFDELAPKGWSWEELQSTKYLPTVEQDTKPNKDYKEK